MEKTKIGIIGLGSIAQLVHLPNLSKMENVEITSVAEVRKSRLNTIADKFNIKERYSNYTEMLQKSEVEAVIITTPTATHKEISVEALKAKKSVLVEKPLARSYEEAKQIVGYAKRNKKPLMVGMNLRFRPDAMVLRSILSTKEIGKPFYVKCGWIRRPSSSEKWFMRKEQSGGGVIVDLGILILDLALWLLDFPKVDSVSTRNFMQNTKNVEDTSVSFLKLKDSTIVNLEASWSLPIKEDHFYLNIYCEKGYASLNPLNIVKKVGDQAIELIPQQKENPLNLFRKSYQNELKGFLGVVKRINPVISSGDEALYRLKIMEAMYKSSKENKEIKV
jgi:predicted dehydrogenase